MATELAPANEASYDVSSDRAVPSDALDSPDALNFWEPEDDQAKPEDQTQGNETDREPAETPEGQEAENTDQQTDEETDEAKADTPAEPEDSVVIAMPGGEKLELKELKSGYMRDRDYRHKTTEIANKRRELETLSTRVTQAVDAVSEILMAQVPPAPDPSLSLTDPLRFIQEKAVHEQAMERINAIVEKANSAKQVTDTLTAEQRTEQVRSEIAKLTDAFPQTKTPEGQKKFFEASVGAMREIGYTDAEINGVTDHRMFRGAYYVALGLKAEAASKRAAQKVVNVPPVTAQRRPAGPNAAKTRANQEALKRLNSSGSIQDAMAVDFD